MPTLHSVKGGMLFGHTCGVGDVDDEIFAASFQDFVCKKALQMGLCWVFVWCFCLVLGINVNDGSELEIEQIIGSSDGEASHRA